MKTFAMYCLVFFVLIAGQSAFAQTSPALKDCKTLEDSLQYLRKEFVESNRFVGKPAEELYQACKAISPLNGIELETSPYIDPEGKSYLSGVKVRLAEKWTKARRFIVINVYFEDTHVSIMDFRKTVPIDKVFEHTRKYASSGRKPRFQYRARP